MPSTPCYTLIPIAANTAADLRKGGGEVYVADAVPGYPCRQCLRDADIGEELILVSHDPFTSDSPYRSSSPIFLHREPCMPAEPTASLPLQLTRRQLSVRAFDADEMMIEAAVVDGTDLQPTLEQFFGDDTAERVHVHNAARGCWAVAVHRAGDERQVFGADTL